MSVVTEGLPWLAKLAEEGGGTELKGLAERLEVAPRTVRAWIVNGKRGVKLEAFRVGGHKLMVSWAAVLRFLERTAPPTEIRPHTKRAAPHNDERTRLAAFKLGPE